MAPEVSVSMHVVSAPMLPKRSWGFVTFYIHLPRSATAAGITFDHDVIPIDSVTGSIAFFEDGAVDTPTHTRASTTRMPTVSTSLCKRLRAVVLCSVYVPICVCACRVFVPEGALLFLSPTSANT